MASLPTASLIIPTYDWPEALELCLESLLRQQTLPTEVVVADDGSTEDTRALIDAFRDRLPVPLQHVWQPDDGFQKCRILNKAIAAARGDYLIQIDGDQILHPRLVADHLRAARPGYFVCGNRAWLSPALTARVLRDKQVRFSMWQRGLGCRLNALHLPALAPFVPKLLTNERGLANLRGSNMAFWRKDLIAVNGYDESIRGWGREDTELVVRLYNAGRRRRHLTLAGIVYHLHHRHCDRDRLPDNDAILQQALGRGLAHCAQGIHQYLGQG